MHDATLVWVTPDAEAIIGYCARVSNPANQTNHATAPRLLRYCIEHQHWSVFEMASMCLEVRTTRAISAQLLRHRSFSFQEFSLRYAEAVGQPEMPQLRLQDFKNRQNSLPIADDDPLLPALYHDIAEHFDRSSRLYGQLLGHGIAREVARDVLPLATPTRLYMSGTIRSWIHYVQLRCANGTQREHQRIAESARAILFRELPTIAEALSHD
jgi:thymidylate synthase (FAD)